jgi:hypothetical protein
MVEPELVQVSKLGALDLSIEVWRTWRDRSKFDALAHQTPLHRFGEELATPVSLDTLDRKRHLLDHALKEKQRIPSISAGIDAQYAEARAVVDRRVLIDASRNLHCVHLDPIPRNRAAIAFGMCRPPGTY